MRLREDSVMRRPGTMLWLALLVPGPAACTDGGPELENHVERLAEHRGLWQSTRPAAYTYAVERLCYCLLPGPVRVIVREGAATERVYVETGDPVPQELADLYPTVDGLFDLLAQAFGSGAHEVDVSYDPTTGVPVDFWIDYEENVADEELGMRVVELVRPADPDA